MARSPVVVLIPVRMYSPLYCLVAFLTIALAHAESHARFDEMLSKQTGSEITRPETEVLQEREIFRRIGIFEEAAQEAESRHANHPTAIEIYRNLGNLYYVAGMLPRAEAATKRAIQLMKDGPKDQLAEEFNHLSLIHGLMEELRKAENDEMQTLAIREKIGDPVGLALTWIDIAGLYLKEGKYKKALGYAQKSYEMLENRFDMKPSNHIAVRQVMAFSLCRTHQCNKGLPLMKQAVEEAKNAYGQESLSMAAEGFALGLVYWMNGDIPDASDWMPRSLARMRVDIGWNNPLYVNAMRQYTQFLRKTGQREEAYRAEAELHRIESVVDVRTLTTQGWKSLLSGTHQ